MKDETQKRIENIFLQGGISPEDRQMWMKRLDESDDSFGEMFLAIFEGEPELIRFATVDIKSHILAQGNPEELEKVRLREVEYFRSVSGKEE